MALIEIENNSTGRRIVVNTMGIVGIGERNERGDVMLIQALFKLVGFTEAMSKLKFGLSMTELPAVTGILDKKTIRAIKAYQRQNAHRLLRIDGKIHPATYENRIIKNILDGRLMTITLLNEDAIFGAVSVPGGFIQAIRHFAPAILLTQKIST